MENLEIGARLRDPEEHAVILLAAVNGCAVEESIVGLHEAARRVVAVQEPAAALGEGKELGELPKGVSLKRVPPWGSETPSSVTCAAP